MTNRRRLALVAGVRLNLDKIAQLMRVCGASGAFDLHLLHTGQHPTLDADGAYLGELRMRPSDVVMQGDGSMQGERTVQMLAAIARNLVKHRLERAVTVPGVDSIQLATLAAAKLRITVAHVEAGLGRGDRHMPEEINETW